MPLLRFSIEVNVDLRHGLPSEETVLALSKRILEVVEPYTTEEKVRKFEVHEIAEVLDVPGDADAINSILQRMADNRKSLKARNQTMIDRHMTP